MGLGGRVFRNNYEGHMDKTKGGWNREGGGDGWGWGGVVGGKRQTTVFNNNKIKKEKKRKKKCVDSTPGEQLYL